MSVLSLPSPSTTVAAPAFAIGSRKLAVPGRPADPPTLAHHLAVPPPPARPLALVTGNAPAELPAHPVPVRRGAAGRRLTEMFRGRHSLYNGGFRSDILRDLLARDPEKVIRSAVWGMIPHGRLGRQMIKKLKVYAGGEHPHAAQKPAAMSV